MKIEFLLLVYLLLELAESYFQRGSTIKELLIYNSMLFDKNIPFYILIHSSYFFLLFLYLKFSYSLLLAALLLKTFDLSYKLYLVGRVIKEGTTYIDRMLGGNDIELKPLYKYLSNAIYFILVFKAFYG